MLTAAIAIFLLVPAAPAGAQHVQIVSGPPAWTNQTSASFGLSSDEPEAVECRLDAHVNPRARWQPCEDGHIVPGPLAEGRHMLEARVAGGSDEADRWTWRVDVTAPSIPTIYEPTGRWHLERHVTATWGATDSGSGVHAYDVRYDIWSAAGSASSGRTWLEAATATGAALPARTGRTYCLRVRVEDRAGNSAPRASAPRCFARPLDEAALERRGPWKRHTRVDGYLGSSYIETTAEGAFARAVVSAKRLLLVAMRCPACGSVEVRWRGEVVKSIDLSASRTTKSARIPVASLPALDRGTVRIDVTSAGRRVRIDGVGRARYEPRGGARRAHPARRGARRRPRAGAGAERAAAPEHPRDRHRRPAQGDARGDACDAEAFHPRGEGLPERVRDDAALLPFTGVDPDGTLRPQPRRPHAAAPELRRAHDHRPLPEAGRLFERDRGQVPHRWGTRPDFTPVSPPYFDLWATTRPNAGGYFNTVFNLNGRLQTVKEYSTGYIGDKTIRFLRSFERRDKRPWFMYTAVVAPHAPNDPEGKHKRARVSAWPGDPAVFEGDRTDKPPYVQRREAGFDLGRRVRRRQLRTLMSVDDMIRKIFAELRANREDRKTLAFFLSDNGLLWAQHGLLNKTVPYLQSIRVPLLARWPARIPGGSRDDRLVANVDLAPTIAQVAGLGAASPPMDGRSLFSRQWDRDHLLVEYFEGDTGIAPTWASITAPTHQYVEYYDEDGNETFREYYDLVRDPWQLVNTLGDFDPTNDPSPARLSELSARLAVERECVGSLCP